MIIWDEKKRKQVIKDHGVDLDKIADVFDENDDTRIITARRAEAWMVTVYEKERKRL